jgi:hypothetical protein
MQAAGKNTRIALTFSVVLAATAGASQVFGADQALLTLEDDWRRAATFAVQDEARSRGITIVDEHAAFTLLPGAGGTLSSTPGNSASHVLYLSRPAHRLKAGLYQAVVDSAGRAKLFYFDPQLGRLTATLRVPPGDPVAFHTPLGDDMCKNAPNLLMAFCQTFVACAAYDFFC